MAPSGESRDSAPVSRTTDGEEPAIAHEQATREGALPALLTPLVGRDAELPRISRMLRDRAARLLVLTGPGGVGKTRLAIAVAEHLQTTFTDGVVFVDLSTTTSTDNVLPAIASAIGVSQGGSDHLPTALHDELADKNILLILDNFEQLLGAAGLLTDLLTASYSLSMLVTSRSVLSVYGEFVFPVPPLRTPNLMQVTADEVAETESAQLFIRRVQSLHPGFQLTERNAQHIATICTRLDGLPLAIELAAARSKLFSVATLAHRLNHRLPMLEDGPRNLPERLRTMRNAISWSYELLSPFEQSIFRRLAIFIGPWNLEAARAVALPDGEPTPDHEIQLIDALGSLSDKSLIQQAESIEDDRHFRILQTLREFALEELENHGELEETLDRYTAFFTDFARRAQPHLTAGNQVLWLNRLDAFYNDIQAIFERLMHQDPPELALDLATRLWRFGYMRGHILETRTWLQRALDRATERTVLRAEALNGAGLLSSMAGDQDDARGYYEEALAIAREHNNQRAMATALFGLGDLAAVDKDAGQAEQSYMEAERLYTELDDARGIAVSQTNLGNLYWETGRIDEALSLNEAARRMYDAINDKRGVAWSYTNVGRLAAGRGEYSRAIANLSDAARLYQQLGDRSGMAETLEAFALIATDAHQYSHAALLLGAADRLREEIGHQVPEPDKALLEQVEQRVRKALGKPVAEQMARGRALPLQEAMFLATSMDVADATGSVPDVDHERSEAIAQRGITERELDVLQRLGAGDSDKEIAGHLFISVRTVQSHVQNLLNKFEVTSRSAAVARAFRDGILR